MSGDTASSLVMRPRAVGGYEPNEQGQRELVDLWHVSLTALSGKSPTRGERIAYAVGEFVKAHPEVAYKWPYVWATDQLGLHISTGAPRRGPRQKANR